MFNLVFPITSRFASLELVQEIAIDDSLKAIIRLIIFEYHDGIKQVSNIKEQEVYFGNKDPRFENYLLGWAEAIKIVFQVFDRRMDQWVSDPFNNKSLSTLMPHDLVFHDLLKLKASAPDQFTKATLVKSRLGWFLD